jgi:alkylation response protein AidB-like acyl-CoA dehydrogenase
LINEILGRSPYAPRLFNCAAPDAGNMELLHIAANAGQRKKYLEPLVAAEVRSCFAMTEPEVAGSDPTLIQARGEIDGGSWVINGHKWFITGAMGASFAIAMVVTNPEADRHDRASMIIIDAGTPGFQVVRPVPVMGSHGPGGHCEIRFENCRVPKENLLGEQGQGFQLAQARLGPGRIQHCMRWLGVAQRAFEMLCRRALSRAAFGGALAEKQTVQNWIADSAAEIEAARLMTLQAAWKMDQKLDSRVDISLIKFFGAKVLHDVLDRAIQVHGALGYSADLPLEAFYREARAARIYDGADEVHRVSVAKRILKSLQQKEHDGA